MSTILTKPVEERQRWHWHWQNLNERKDGSCGSGFWNGRCWWHLATGMIGLEWLFGKARFHIGFGIDDYDLTIAFCVPLMSLYLSIESRKWLRRWQPMECSKYLGDPILLPTRRECSVSIHDGTVWFHPWIDPNEWRRSDPWWRRGVNWCFNPFDWRHIRHSVQCADWSRGTAPYTYWVPFVGTWEQEKQPDGRELMVYPYRYVLKDGTVQDRTATIYVSQMEWRPRCLQWTSLFAKVRTTIDITFDDEVGERTGSWKGGTTGCSYELRPGETPLECLRRMEKERIFD